MDKVIVLEPKGAKRRDFSFISLAIQGKKIPNDIIGTDFGKNVEAIIDPKNLSDPTRTFFNSELRDGYKAIILCGGQNTANDFASAERMVDELATHTPVRSFESEGMKVQVLSM